FAGAVALALALALAASLAILGAALLLGPQRSERTAGPLGDARPSAAVGRRRPSIAALLATLLAWLVIGLTLVVPLVALVLSALARAPGLPPLPASWTLDNFAAALDRHALAALGNSLLLSAVAAVGVLALAGLALVAAGGRASRLASSGIGLTFAIPGSTLAVAVLLAYGPLLRDTLLIILLAYLAKFWLLGYRPLAAGLEQLPADLARAARMAGASAATTLRTITAPLLLPTAAAAALLVFLFGLHEITISSLLYGPGTATLAVVVLNAQQLGDPNLTAALAVLLSLLVALPALALLAIGRRRGGLAGWL
ncbi:MAG TPA: ABC transporter permease subunit, partial [Candidatus Limnocylindrales bacterium]